MTQILLMACVVVLSSACCATLRMKDPLQARRVACGALALAMLVALLFAGLRETFTTTPLSFAQVCMIGLIACALTPLSSSGHQVFARILGLSVLSFGFIMTTNLLMLSLLWCLSAVVLIDYERQALTASHLVMRLNVPSILLFFIGALAVAADYPTIATYALVLAIAIRQGLILAHFWLVDLIERGAMGLAVAFFCPQLGIVAFQAAFLEHLSDKVTTCIAVIGAVTALFAAVLASVQTKMRRFLAFFMISQSGLITFGFENHSLVAERGGLLLAQVVGLSCAGLLMVTAALEARRGPLHLEGPNGDLAATPRMAAAFLLLGFMSVGLPLSVGFMAEDLLFQGAMEQFPVLAVVLVLTTALNGIGVMRCFFYLFGGVRGKPWEQDFVARETWVVSGLLLLLAVMGALPGLTLLNL